MAANEVVVLSLTDYDAVFAVLAAAEGALAGKVIVNLSSDTPARAREAARWLAARGAGQLTGGVQSPPSGIGRAESSTFYSGPAELFRRHRETLEVLTGADYRGDDPGLAQLYYQIQMDLFWTSLLGYLHATAVAEAHGISAEEFLPYASSTAASMPDFLAFYAPGSRPASTRATWTGSRWVWPVPNTSCTRWRPPGWTARCPRCWSRPSGAGSRPGTASPARPV